jgi:hypothetical protein
VGPKTLHLLRLAASCRRLPGDAARAVRLRDLPAAHGLFVRLAAESRALSAAAAEARQAWRKRRSVSGSGGDS